MKSMFALAAFCCLLVPNKSAPSLPVNPGGIGGLFKGPNSETIIQGPDGSIITSAAEGGAVLLEDNPIIVAEPAPVSVVVKHEEKVQSSDLVGPSGVISTRGQESIVAGPASTTITGSSRIVAETAPIIGDHAAVPVVTVGSDVIGEEVVVKREPLVTTSGFSATQADPRLISVTTSDQAISHAIPSSLVPTPPSVDILAADVSAGISLKSTVSGLDLGVTALPPLSPFQSPYGGFVGINDHIDLGPQSDIQRSSNPTSISSVNIVPPEMALASTSASQIADRSLSSQAINIGSGSATNIEINEAIRLEPNDLLLKNPEVQKSASNGVLITRNGNPTIGLGGTTDPRLLTSILNVASKLDQWDGNRGGLIQNGASTVSTLFAIQEQDLINAELAKMGIDESQVQVTGVTSLQRPQVPLLRNTNPITSQDLLRKQAYVSETGIRYGRDANKNT